MEAVVLFRNLRDNSVYATIYNLSGNFLSRGGRRDQAEEEAYDIWLSAHTEGRETWELIGIANVPHRNAYGYQIFSYGEMGRE